MSSIPQKVVDRVNEDLARAHASYQAEAAKFAADSLANFEYTFTWKAGSVLEAQAALEVAVEIGVLNIVTDGDETLYTYDGTTSFRIRDWMRRFERSLSLVRGESGSTSDLTNIAARVKLAYRAGFYSSLRDGIEYGTL